MKRLSPSPLPQWAEINDLPWLDVQVVKEVAAATCVPHENWMQDWPIEVADQINLLHVLSLAEREIQTTARPDFLAAYLTMMIAALEVADLEPVFSDKALLVRIETALSSYPEVMNYWLCLEEDDSSSEVCFPVTPWLRGLAYKLQTEKEG